ncbi:protein MAIN-LIKE 2-like isoform X2 [Salvia divinorum]|uniref:Protein MAIN-LIKE 2-like isoform X2 n=1 Tax=Salvia divinorum TaxID=28513 RepID=A0ABD1HGH3_SALDI
MDYYATNPGPIDDSVLKDQDKHVSAAVWEGQERGALRCHEHTSKLDRVTYTTCDSVCIKYLGKAPDSGYTSGGMVKLSWLKEAFSECPEDASIEDVKRHTRAYLLYLVGSTIFSTTTAALSFLYRALGNASLRSQSTISGCLTLLQCWSYYHLNVGRPKLHHDPIHECFPFVLRWKGKHSGPTSNRDVIFYRKALDSLKATDVDWCPYANISHTVIAESILNQLIFGRSKTMLICFDKAERHLPDRCLRQFGIHQMVPEEVQHWERKTRGVDGGVDLSGKMEAELNEWENRRFHIVEAEEDLDEGEYVNWYSRITRRLVGRSIPISSEFQRMNAALRNIAHVADTLSTHGMDDQQIQSVTRIRYIAHECLRDHAGTSTLPLDNSESEVNKKIRGKERVRRRGTSKRRRKDDPEEFYASGMHIQVYHVPNEVDHEQHLCLPLIPGHTLPPTQRIDGVTEYNCNNEADQHEVEEVDEDHLSHGSEENPCESLTNVGVVEQPSLGTSEDMTHQNDFSVTV